MTYKEIYHNSHLNKSGAAMLTPEALAAAAQPPMPPAGTPPIDPAMMGAPAGAPPMDPAMMGAPAGAPTGAWMQDPMFMDFLMQMGVQVDPNTGAVIDPNGQPIPPEQMDQIYMMFQQLMQNQQGMMPPQGGAPAGAPPVDPAMMGAPAGAPPMDPAMGGMPQEIPPEEQANMIASIIMDSVNAVMDLKLAVIDKKISAFADKLDAVKNMLDDLALSKEKSTVLQLSEDLNAELLSELRNAQPLQSKTASYKAGNILNCLRG